LKMSSYHGRSDARIYVGNLPPDIRSRDIESCFERFGKVVAVDLKNRKGPPFAFVEFEDARDAEDAVRFKDGYELDGYKLRVEFPRGSGVHPGYNPRNRMLAGRNGCRTNASRHTGFRCYISGLPASGSWQDLKDHMREAGDVCFSDVYKNGNGVVEYMRAEDLEYALANLNKSRFRSHEGEVSYIQVSAVDENEENSRSRSRSRSRTHSPSDRASPLRRRGTAGNNNSNPTTSIDNENGRGVKMEVACSRSRSP
ncbi:Serine/arginine-rich splicing factor 1, partial [Trichinella pseudospiralis]